jgi:peroxiredoxin
MLVLIVSSCNKDNLNPGDGARIGDYLPGFALNNLDGDTVHLSDFDGKIVLVELWASWCSYCNTEAPVLNTLYNRYKTENFEIIGISIDKNKTDWKNKVKHHGITYTQVNDPRGFDAPVVEAYNVESIPKMILLNADGQVVLITTKAADVEEYLQRVYP